MTTTLPDAAGVILLTEDGYFLCQRRSMSKKMFPGHYEIPGGKIEENESPAQAAVRELHEEAGILLPIEQLGEVFAFTPVTLPEASYTGHVFLVRMPACFHCPQINGEAGSEWRWEPIGSLSSRIKGGDSHALTIPGAIPAIHMAADLWQKEDTDRRTKRGEFERWGWSPHILYHRNKNQDIKRPYGPDEKFDPWRMNFFQETDFVLKQRSYVHRPECCNLTVAGSLTAPFIGTKLTVVKEFYDEEARVRFEEAEITVRIGERIAWSMPVALMKSNEGTYSYDFTKHPAIIPLGFTNQLVSRPERDDYINGLQTSWPLAIPAKQNLMATLYVKDLMPHQVIASVYIHGFIAKEWA